MFFHVALFVKILFTLRGFDTFLQKKCIYFADI